MLQAKFREAFAKRLEARLHIIRLVARLTHQFDCGKLRKLFRSPATFGIGRLPFGSYPKPFQKVLVGAKGLRSADQANQGGLDGVVAFGTELGIRERLSQPPVDPTAARFVERSISNWVACAKSFQQCDKVAANHFCRLRFHLVWSLASLITVVSVARKFADDGAESGGGRSYAFYDSALRVPAEAAEGAMRRSPISDFDYQKMRAVLLLLPEGNDAG